MDSLLPYYERELGFLREECKQLCEVHPSLSGLLGGSGGGESADPLAERIIQALAMLAGRAAKRHEDGYPRLTEALLESIEPALLRQFPPSTIVQFECGKDATPATVPRGTPMTSRPVDGVKCMFKTVYPVELAAFQLTSAEFSNDVTAPRLNLPKDTTGRISIGWPALSRNPPRRIRIFIDGDRAFSAALRDTLFLNARTAYVHASGTSSWKPLSSVPIHACGFGPDDAMVPADARSHPAYSLLTEFFAFPEKFSFVELDLGALLEQVPEAIRGATLHIALHDVPPDSDRARMLSPLAPQHLQLNCTPAVNLFVRAGVPINVTNTEPDYLLRTDAIRPDAYDIVAVHAARIIDCSSGTAKVTELSPFYSTRYAQADTPYWVVSRDYAGDFGGQRPPLRIALVDQDLEPSGASVQTISTELLCSNGILPSLLVCGAAEGDLEASGGFGAARVRFLRKPTLPAWPASGRGTHWKLVSQLALGSRPLTHLGLREFQEMLLLYDLTRSTTAARMIDAIARITFEQSMDWVFADGSASLMPGVDVTIAIRPEAFSSTGTHAFAQVLDHFFGMYGQLNMFARLKVTAEDGRELMRFAARSGRGLA